MHNLKNQDSKKPCVIAGNGPSLAAIDYARLPKDFDVFRCNQFYLEDKYYLGREVKLAFATPWVLFEQLYTLRTLHYRGEYDIGGVVSTTYGLRYLDVCHLESKDFFKDVIEGHSHLEKLDRFNEFIRYNEIFMHRRITSGVYMCAIATALGYRQIYLAGLDFYEGSKPYAFDFEKQNLLKVVPSLITSKGKPYEAHGKDIDLEGLEFLAKHYDVQFFCLCPGSPLSDYLPLASPTAGGMRPESKNEDSTKDMLIPESTAYGKRGKGVRPGDEDIDKYHDYKTPLKNNFFYKVLIDMVRLPGDIARYVRGKLLLARWKKARYGGGGGGPIPGHPQTNNKHTDKPKPPS